MIFGESSEREKRGTFARDRMEEVRARIRAEESEPVRDEIETFENGQPVESSEQEVPQVKIGEPEVTPVDDRSPENPSGEGGLAVPEEVAEADGEIAEVVEDELQIEGADSKVVEAEVGAKTELSPGDIPVVKKHEAFVRASGEAEAGDAAEIEKVWDPLKENEPV